MKATKEYVKANSDTSKTAVEDSESGEMGLFGTHFFFALIYPLALLITLSLSLFGFTILTHTLSLFSLFSLAS